MKNSIEIFEQIDKASELIEQDGKYFGMTYEQGIKDALEWVSGYVENKPIED